MKVKSQKSRLRRGFGGQAKLKTAWLIFFILVFSLIFPKAVFAEVTVIVNHSPTEIRVLEEFDVDFSATGLDPSTSYYGKVRVGVGSTAMDQGETFNSSSRVWLGDSGSGNEWSNFPTFSSNDLGNLSGTLRARAISSSVQGENDLIIRIRKIGTSNNKDSSAVVLNILPPLSPTLTPTAPPTLTLSPTTFLSPTLTPISYSGIYINEFLPDPESGSEKVEIKNSSSSSVSLVNWQIDDIENGGHSPKTFSADISPSGLYTVDLGTNSFLNNDGDSVRLLDFGGVQKDRKDYSSSEKNKSWSKDRNGNWCLLDSSFNSENSDCPQSPTSTPTPVPATAVPTAVPTLTKTPTPSLSLTPTATESAEILGATASGEVVVSEVPTEAPVNSTENKKPGIFRFLPFLLIIPGAGLIGFALFSFLKAKGGLKNATLV